MSRQNYYLARKQRCRRSIECGRVLELTRRERAPQPRLGTRKTFGIISGELADAGIKLGRDRYFDMTENFHCYENALAERVNGILKQEYELDGVFPSKSLGIKAFLQAVYLYNNRRPHMGIGYRIPAEFHSAKEEASARLRLAEPSTLRVAPSGTGSALRSRASSEQGARGSGIRKDVKTLRSSKSI
jgi:hypothetical protein